MRKRSTAGEIRKILRSTGAEEYAVVANKIARTLRIKSVKSPAGL